jgi:putative intracellular protease/amidase
MAKDNLEGLNVAILVTDGFEQVELTEPRKALDEAGATTKIVSPKRDRVRACYFTEWSVELPVDVALDQTKPVSITSGTLFASHKLPLRGYLAAIAVFCNEVKGKSALAISRDLGLSYKSAFVLLHKLREAWQMN